MRKLTFEFPSEGLSKDDIELLQKNYSLVLPKSYIFFLSINNGGCPLEYVFYHANNQTNSIQNFYEVKNGKIEAADIYYESFMSRDFFPFGEDPGGFVFVISLREKDYGYIYLYSYEDVEENDECLRFISKSFEKFIDNLEPDKG